MIKKIMIVILFVGMNRVNAGWQNIEQRVQRAQQEQLNEYRLNNLARLIPHIEVNRQRVVRDLFGAQEMIIDDLLRDEHENVHADDQMELLIENLAQRGLRLVVDIVRGRNFFIVRDNDGNVEIPVNEIEFIPRGERLNTLLENQVQALQRIENVQLGRIEAERESLDRMRLASEARRERMRQERLDRLNPLRSGRRFTNNENNQQHQR